jgi:hypothetical protein
MNPYEANMKYGRLVVLIRHNSADTWGFRYGLKFVIGTLKIMAGTGVFVRVLCALRNSIKNFPWTPGINLTYIKLK